MLRPILLAALCSTATVAANAQTCSCPALLDSVKVTVTNNYPGMADKLRPETGASFAEMNNRVMQAASLARTDSACYAAVRSWVNWFQDGHLRLVTPGPSTNGDHPVTSVPTRPVSEAEVKAMKTDDPLIGIWGDGNYRLAVVPAIDDANGFDAVVLETGNRAWKAGDVKGRFTKKNNSYTVDWTFGDRAEGHVFPAMIVGNILDLEENFLAREWPTAAKPTELEAYAYDRDPTNPKLTFPEPDVALFTLRSFNPMNMPLMDTLLARNRSALGRIPNWIIDLRGNEGGAVHCGRKLLPYIQTGPVKRYNTHKRVSRENVDQWWNEYIAEAYAEFDPRTKQIFDARRMDLLAHTGTLYNPDSVAFKMIQPDSVSAYPERVVILMDSDCVSSGELFIIEARQSTKVTVMGINSGGMIDYGDVLHYPMPCTNVTLNLPFTRYTWLDEGVSVDAGGLRPDVVLPVGSDWMKAALETVRKAR
ncbi:MAG: hypothetical protein JNM91_09750 [Flavobacteriales bacterium]|nr:hypothetical protein [Flavobacteriales bacterium]